MLPFATSMPCLSTINMLFMTSRCVVECKMILLRLFTFLYKRLLLRSKKVGKVDKNEQRLVEILSIALEN
jgi:hypothetical protein